MKSEGGGVGGGGKEDSPFVKNRSCIVISSEMTMLL